MCVGDCAHFVAALCCSYAPSSNLWVNFRVEQESGAISLQPPACNPHVVLSHCDCTAALFCVERICRRVKLAIPMAACLPLTWT
jgi:hypothetical protein